MADKSKAKPDPMRHVRGKLPGRPETGLKEIIVEQRGLRVFKRSVYADPRMTAMQAAFDGESPMHDYDDLRKQADAVLEGAGEPTYLKTIAGAGDDAAIFRAIQQWYCDIAERRGHVSREAIAAWFLFTADRLSSQFNISDEQWYSIFSFARAWHEFSLDESGAHERIVASVVSRQNLAAGAMTNAEKKAAKLLAIRSICDEIWTNKPVYKGKLRQTAFRNFDHINSRLVSGHHAASKTPAALEKLVQAAFKS